MWSAFRGDGSITGLLLERKADVNAADREASTALIMAARTDNVAIVQSILEHGAHIEAADALGRPP